MSPPSSNFCILEPWILSAETLWDYPNEGKKTHWQSLKKENENEHELHGTLGPVTTNSPSRPIALLPKKIIAHEHIFLLNH